MRLPFGSRPTIPVVRLHGVIGAGSALRPGLSLSGVEAALAKAFALKAPAVALVVNSPGGAAAQSSLIAARLRSLAAERKRPVLAFVEDVAASGGYWLATAADEIFCDATSIVGSIGVVSASFGFTEAIARIGVERRLHTVGENKALLDPFLPERERDVAILTALQGDIHEAFVAQVRARRGGKLADDPDLFTGRVWSGEAAVRLGLADGLGNLRDTVRARYGPRARLRPIATGKPGFLRARLGLGDAAEDLVAALETRAVGPLRSLARDRPARCRPPRAAATAPRESRRVRDVRPGRAGPPTASGHDRRRRWQSSRQAHRPQQPPRNRPVRTSYRVAVVAERRDAGPVLRPPVMPRHATRSVPLGTGAAPARRTAPA